MAKLALRKNYALVRAFLYEYDFLLVRERYLLVIIESIPFFFIANQERYLILAIHQNLPVTSNYALHIFMNVLIRGKKSNKHTFFVSVCLNYQ